MPLLFCHPADLDKINSFLTFGDTTTFTKWENERTLRSGTQSIQSATWTSRAWAWWEDRWPWVSLKNSTGPGGKRRECLQRNEQRGQLLLENLEMSGFVDLGPPVMVSVEMAKMPCPLLWSEREEIVSNLLASLQPLLTSFRIAKYMFILHPASKRQTAEEETHN